MQQKEVNVDMVAVGSSAGWDEPKVMCERRCWEDGFDHFQIASMMVEEKGDLHMVNICESYHNQRQSERKEPQVSGKQWKRLFGMKRSRGELAVGLGAMGLRAQDHDYLRGQEDLRENLLKEAAVAPGLGMEWPECVATQ